MTCLVADFGTDGADARAVDQPAGVAVVPVLVGKLTLSQRKCAQLAVGGSGGGGGGGGRNINRNHMLQKCTECWQALYNEVDPLPISHTHTLTSQ